MGVSRETRSRQPSLQRQNTFRQCVEYRCTHGVDGLRAGKTHPPGEHDAPLRRRFTEGAQAQQRVALARALTGLSGEVVDPAHFNTGVLPDHLGVRYVITDGRRTLGAGKDFGELREQFAPRLARRLSGRFTSEAAAARLRAVGTSAHARGRRCGLLI